MVEETSAEDRVAMARSVVERYYSLIDASNVEGVDAFVVDTFSADSSVSRPESLRGGGRLAGLERVRRFSRSAAAHSGGPGAMRVGAVFERLTENGMDLVVELQFRIGDVWSRALEWWTFEEGLVVSIQAFYWDTAALAPPGQAST
jgi:hypothetical protein